MKTQGTNLFIVDDNKLMVTDLKHYLKQRFGDSLNVTVFGSGDSCIEMIDVNTHIVILDYYPEGKSGLEILKSIKKINPKTEVIMLSSNEDIGMAIEAFHKGANDVIIRGKGSLKKISAVVNKILTEPLRLMVREFGISKYMAAFLITFAIMGLVVYGVLNTISN